MNMDGPSLAGICKVADVRFDLPHGASIKARLIALMDVMAEFTPGKILVLCNIAVYLQR